MDMQIPFATDGDAPAEVRVPARLLEYAPGEFVAFAAHATMGLVEQPRWLHVPGAPRHALGLLEWEGRQIPLLDLAALLRGEEADTARASGHVLVLAYQRGAGQPLEYGALCAPALVRIVAVGDSQQCPLPDGSLLWPRLASSCFSHAGQAVPIVDAARLFAPHPH